MKYIIISNWKYIHKSKTSVTEDINESNNIFGNMQPPNDLKGRHIAGGPNSPTQDISDLLEKILAPIVSCLKKDIEED